MSLCPSRRHTWSCILMWWNCSGSCLVVWSCTAGYTQRSLCPGHSSTQWECPQSRPERHKGSDRKHRLEQVTDGAGRCYGRQMLPDMFCSWKVQGVFVILMGLCHKKQYWWTWMCDSGRRIKPKHMTKKKTEHDKASISQTKTEKRHGDILILDMLLLSLSAV